MVDQIDEQLIRLLMQDARRSSKAFAEQLKISPAAVRRRINRLIEEDVVRIIGFPDPAKMGFPLRVIISLNVLREKTNHVIEELNKRPEIIFLAPTSGRYDIVAIGWFSSTSTLYEFMDTVIGKVDGVTSTETFICLQQAKTMRDGLC
ncbi:MAG: Lrp/AsnC family transcriptional regulator [Dehalococcoidia bacterium]